MSTLVEVKSLRKYFPLKGWFLSREKFVHAVDGVDFNIKQGETFALVGESGSGKTTIGKLLLKLIEPTSGSVLFAGRNIFGFDKKEIHVFRREAQMIFQNPFSSLNPRKTLRYILSKPYLVYKLVDPQDVEKRVIELLETVGLTPGSIYLNRFPHELSGGQRQRVAIARALAIRPKFVVADEPVSSLDVSVRAQIINLMKNLQKTFDLTYLYITHDLSVVRSICNRVAVIYLGKIVELADVEDLFANALHPYTQALLSSVPIPNPKKSRCRSRIILKGSPPSLIDPPPGCRFHTRCLHVMDKCTKVEPELVDKGRNHLVACHLV